MKLIISPAKKMRTDTDTFAAHSLPQFLSKTDQLLSQLRAMSYDELKALWRCSDSIAARNFDRLQTMDLRRHLTPAILAYEGIQYQYMAPGVFTDDQFRYIETHLRILSGFYDILRPFDGVTPYRLEMQAPLSGDGFRSLYDFWGSSLAKSLILQDDTVLNLASKEYSRCITEHLPAGIRLLNCTFGKLSSGRILETGTKCKMARGEMVRFLAENEVEDPEHCRAFNRLHYVFSPEHSTGTNFVFLQT